MSAAEAVPAAEAAAPPKKSRKKLLLIVLVATLALVLAGGTATYVLLKKRAAAAAAAEEDGESAADAAKPKAHKGTPNFVALESFTVNLADREAERYAQIGVTLELDDAKFADEMKTYMPAIRNAVLMILAHKTSQELLERSGKQALAEEIMREVPRTMGLDVGAPAQAASGAKKAKDGAPPVHNPVRNVLFSNFIIQ